MTLVIIKTRNPPLTYPIEVTVMSVCLQAFFPSLNTLTPWKESYDQPRQHIEKQRHYFFNKGPSSQGCGFSSGCVWMSELDCEEGWAPKNWCFWTVMLEKTLESLLDCKELSVLNIHWKDWCWSWNFNTLTTSCEELTLWKRPWCWEGLGAGGEGDDRGWDGWMASPTRCTWVWVNSGSWWWTGRLGMLQFMGLQRVGHDWATELNWTDSNMSFDNVSLKTKEKAKCFSSILPLKSLYW